MFQGEVIYKLNTIQLLPQEINIDQKDFSFDERFPIYKLEAWLGNILLDETHQITFSQKNNESASKVLNFGKKKFRYFSRQLFNKQKVARLRIVILRGTATWEQSEQIQSFNIILSQYSYEYCKNKHNQFRQHAVGTATKCLFQYRIICQYEESINHKQNQPNISQKTKHTDALDQVKILPINSLDEDYQFDENASDVFIQLGKLKPVFRNQSQDYDKIRIKVPGSIINAEKTQQKDNSIIKQRKQLKNSALSICYYIYVIYMVMCMGLIVVQMHPAKKL